MNENDNVVREVILSLLSGPKTVAPRDVAQQLAGEGEDWRKYLSQIRAEAVKMHAEGLLLFIRKKQSVDPAGLKGVYRFGRPNQPDL